MSMSRTPTGKAQRRGIPAAVTRLLAPAALATLLAACAAAPPKPARPPSEVRAEIVHLLPSAARDREGWARDIQIAFSALRIDPGTDNLCAVLAVTAQESGFASDPAVPGLGRIARAEIERRAALHHVPVWMLDAALHLESPDGHSYADRIDAVRTERELSRIFEDLIGSVPLGHRLFSDANPVKTGGPMQVSVTFAESHAERHPYPYPVDGSIRHEVFTRRGGLYFGIAHLLGYPAPYDRMLYRFADYNAGFYASRNAAFQNAVSVATGIPLVLDGDLVDYRRDSTGATEAAVLALGPRLDMSPRRIRAALADGESPDFAQSSLYRRVFALAETATRHPLPRAVVPDIALESPKITRKLTTRWFAEHVDQRYRTCLATAAKH